MNSKKITMKDIPIEDRPYERFERVGVTNLSDCELLAIILRTGTKSEMITNIAQRILTINKQKGLNILNDITIDELIKVKGIGRVRAIQLKTVAEIAKRIFKVEMRKGIQFDNPDSIARYYQVEYAGVERECFKALLLDNKLEMISDEVIGTGTMNNIITTPMQVFRSAILKSAKCIILVHNHLSGIAKPSDKDIEFTRNIVECGKIIGIDVEDHLIITKDNYISLRKKYSFLFK